MKVYGPDVGLTFVTVFATLAVGVLIIALVIALTKSSCPFIYADNGSGFVFVGEAFGGAIYPSLEREDFLALPPARDGNTEYRIKITNELREKQFINLAKLVTVQHPVGTSIIPDKYGNLLSIANENQPFSAKTESGIEHLGEICARDSSAFLFDEATNEQNAFSSLLLSFNKPYNAPSGKLVLRTKNSLWLDYAYGKFNEQFGILYNTFAEQQKKKPASELIQWGLDQSIPLSISVETENGWRFVDYLPTIGPLAQRDLAVLIDLCDITSETVNVKLECGYMFWELDYAAMDFSIEEVLSVSSFSPVSATDENGAHLDSLVAYIDNHYVFQPKIGNTLDLTFNLPNKPEGNQSIFLHTSGYYEYIRDYKGIPDLIKLRSFKESGSFTRFSRDLLDQFVSTPGLASAAFTSPDYGD
jgi:hypothetical protein